MFAINYASPIGNMRIVSNGDALISVGWAAVAAEKSNQVLQKTAAQLDEYFAGKRKVFDLPLAPLGTDFQRQAWAVLRTIPYAQTLSYKQQAVRAGRASAVRAIGAANGKNPLPLIVPCHRVIGANGSLTGYAGGIKIKEFLLHHEAKFV